MNDRRRLDWLGFANLAFVVVEGGGFVCLNWTGRRCERRV